MTDQTKPPEFRRLYFGTGWGAGAVVTMAFTFALTLFAPWAWALVCATALVAFAGGLQFWHDIKVVLREWEDETKGSPR